MCAILNSGVSRRATHVKIKAAVGAAVYSPGLAAKRSSANAREVKFDSPKEGFNRGHLSRSDKAANAVQRRLRTLGYRVAMGVSAEYPGIFEQDDAE